MVVHSVVRNQVGYATAERHITVSVNAKPVDALLDFNAMENAVSFETVKVDPKLKIYDFQDDRVKASSRWRLGACGVVWLPIVIGSRSEKLRCVVVEGLTEKLVIGLPGLSFLGASINFATGDVRIGRRRRRKVDGSCSTMAKRSDEVHEDHALVRDAMMKCTKSKDMTVPKVVSSKASPEERKECIKAKVPEQVKDLAGKKGLHDEGRGKSKQEMPNQKEVDPVSGRGRKEEKVNVVSPKQEKKLTITTPDHDDEVSEGECDSGDEDACEPEDIVQCSSAKGKVGKRSHKAKHKDKKKKNKKGKRRR